MSDPAVHHTAAATSDDGRFVLFDADATEPAPDEAPFDAWLTEMSERGLAVGWSEPGPGRRRIRVVPGPAGDRPAPEAVAGDPSPAGTPLRGRLHLPSGRLCFAGLDEAFAARNAELHPGAFGEVVELEPGDYELKLEPLVWPDRSRPARRGVRRGDELIARLIGGGLPLLFVGGLVLAAVAVAIGAWIAGGQSAGRIAGWSLAGGAGLLAAWALLVRAGAMPRLHRVLAARRARAAAHPDAVLSLHRIGDADQSASPASTEAVTGGAGSAT